MSLNFFKIYEKKSFENFTSGSTILKTCTVYCEGQVTPGCFHLLNIRYRYSSEKLFGQYLLKFHFKTKQKVSLPQIEMSFFIVDFMLNWFFRQCNFLLERFHILGVRNYGEIDTIFRTVALLTRQMFCFNWVPVDDWEPTKIPSWPAQDRSAHSIKDINCSWNIMMIEVPYLRK